MPQASTASLMHAGAAFRTTQWSMVLAAGGNDTFESRAALEELCKRYWFPLYTYVRRRGYAEADAADLTQSFFARVIEKQSLNGVSPGPTRFRTFLLAAMKNFLANEWKNANRLKRSPGKAILSLDDTSAEELYRTVPANISSPDKIYDKRWALSVIELVLARLRAEFENTERADLFEALKPSLSADKLDKPYAEIATEFGVSEGNVKIAVHRLRKRFGELLRAEVAQTVKDESEIEAELRYLLQALGES